LIESESLKDIYFFKELHDSILEAQKVRKLKSQVTTTLADLSAVSIHKTADTEKLNITNLCLSLLDRSSVTEVEVDSLRLKFEQLKKRSNHCFEEDEIRQKEHLFLKSQVVLCLENLGYEVMDDLEVIDFERESDLLLKIRNQDNYLNLKFKDDGSIRYVFQIPEGPETLSTDQANLKLHEMKTTCDEFNSVLQDLSRMGLKIDLKSEKPIEHQSLVLVPAGKKDNLKEQAKKRQGRQIRKKYLTVTDR
jgi:hypothetical protein